MQARIETLKAKNNSNEEYLIYPRTLTTCITNEDGENLDTIINDALKNGGSNGGGGASTAAEVSYDDTVGDIPFGADNVQGAFDNLKGILSTFDDYVNSKASETLDAAKAYTDENAGGASAANEVSYDDNNVEGIEMGVDNVQGALDAFKNAFTGMMGMVGDALDEVLDEAKAYTDENVGSGADTHQFSISGKNLETGWYRIAKIPMGKRPCIINLIDCKELDNGFAGAEATLFCDLYRNNVKVTRCKSECDGVDSYVGFDSFNVESIYDDEAGEYCYYLCIHYTNSGHTGQAYSMTITSVYDGEIGWADEYIKPLYFQPLENEIELIANTNNMSDDLEFDLNANVDIVTTEDLKDVGSSHQYMLYSEGVLETGWYIVGRTMGMHSCNINIIDMGVMPGEEMPICVQANVLSSEFIEGSMSNVKILDFSMLGDTPYVGFDKIVTTQTEDEGLVVVMHYTNPGCEEHNCILTITSLMGGEITLGSFSMNAAMQPYDGNILTYLCDEFAEDARTGQVCEFELKAQPDLADILARLEALEAKGASDILDPEGVEF